MDYLGYGTKLAFGQKLVLNNAKQKSSTKCDNPCKNKWENLISMRVSTLRQKLKQKETYFENQIKKKIMTRTLHPMREFCERILSWRKLKMFLPFLWPDGGSNPGQSFVPTFVGTQTIDETVENVANYCFLEL